MPDLIDDTFYIERKKWGNFTSFNEDGKELVTSMTEELCLNATRFYLKGLQEGFPQPDSTYTGVVGGKL
jgi:hypothetical protein